MGNNNKLLVLCWLSKEYFYYCILYFYNGSFTISKNFEHANVVNVTQLFYFNI